MNMTLKAGMVVAMAGMLAACATPSRVTSEGTTDEVVWPQWDKTTVDKVKGVGTFPDLTSLNEVKANMTKNQLYELIGRPHYNEVWRPNEWNYLFHFHTPGIGTNNVTTCQFKVLYDKDKRAQSFYWRPIDPVDSDCTKVAIIPDRNYVPAPVSPVVPVIIPPAQQGAPRIQRYTLSADALFAFDKSDAADMLPKGRQELDELAAHLQKIDHLSSIIVTGHTDRLGTDAYNQGLSMRRARTVVQYLGERGVPVRIMRAYGAGESDPVKQCSDLLPRKQLIDCLQPNRRVTVDVDGSWIVYPQQ